jgi:hypothetical protein
MSARAQIAPARAGVAPGPRRAAASLGALAAAVLALAVCAVAAAPASADVFGPISLASEGSLGGGPPEQVDYAHDAALSGNGRFVAFDGSVAGITGVWRRDLATGAIEQVAGGDAELPSISESGQYVSFTTNEGSSLPAITNDRLDERPRQEAVNVYVRDMAKSPVEAGAFLVASAPSGSSAALTYSPASTTLGAAAAGRSAISADGNEVAFVTTATSNLVSYPAIEEQERLRGETPQPHTPPLQVAVRRISSDETILVSGEYDPTSGQTTQTPGAEAEALGAVYPGHTAFRSPPSYGEWGPDGSPPGASISADGSTVAWMGANIPKQAPMLTGEAAKPHYTEPLWRRITAPTTSTERVTGGSDPANPACAASGEPRLPLPPSPGDPCQGPFVVEPEHGGSQSSGIWSESGGNSGALGDFVPRLSADGYHVAFISTAVPTALGENFNASNREGEPADVYVADMHPGLTRDQALTPLTELAGASGIADTDAVRELGISPAGDQVAFTTRRTAFPLASPALVSPPATESGLNELFAADLGDGTLTRVTHGYNGGPSEMPHPPKPLGEEDAYNAKQSAGAESPSFSADGALIAFSSQASNLVLGDGNTPPAAFGDGGDAFIVARQLPAVLPTPQFVSPAPQTATEPTWQIGVTAASAADGSVRLYVEVPGAGKLRAAAHSTVLASLGGSSARHATHARRKAHRTARAPARLATRSVATAGKEGAAAGGELVTLVLRLAKPYAVLASPRGGLSANVTLSFTAAGHPTLHDSIEVTFVRKSHAAPAHKRRSNRRRGRR